MADCIIQHESGGAQFTSNGFPLISPTGDVGVWQINLKTWLGLSKKMGLDIVNNEVDNIQFGIYLYNTQGPKIWTTYKQYCSGDMS